MKNSIRCCISCILPCGSLDVIRIVHANGRVQEINRTSVQAADIINAYPNHVLKYYVPSSKIILILPPQAHLQRGKIYFLMPATPPLLTRKKKKKINKSDRVDYSTAGPGAGRSDNIINSMLSSSSDRYLTEILSTEKILISTGPGKEYRRRGRTGVWRPHLESILE